MNILTRFVHVLAGALPAPAMDKSQRAFRYIDNPDHRHFILLRCCRVVSALNASLVLARAGYPQEIGVLHRVVKESTSQVAAVTAQLAADNRLNGELASFILSYFKDSERSENREPVAQPKLSQKYVNELIGRELDPFNQVDPSDPKPKSMAERHRHLDWIFSNYVHGRYPETMDLYGGRPGRFHLHGMRGTTKDIENLTLLEELIVSVSLCFVRACQVLKLDNELNCDPKLVAWRQSLGKFDR